jgi:uncharacterized protein
MRHVFVQLSAQLAPKYTYHSLSHTTMVLRDAIFIANKIGISDQDMRLLKTAISFHDFGFVSSHENHEQRGCKEARKVLPLYNYTSGEIDKICGMIMATKIPQSPKNLLEEIICDADLFYLGTQYYFQVAALFEKELTALGILKSKQQWTDIQVSFLEHHNYHTEFARQLLEETKQNNLAIIKCCN